MLELGDAPADQVCQNLLMFYLSTCLNGFIGHGECTAYVMKVSAFE